MNTLTQKLLFRQSVILSQLYYSINAMLFKGVEWSSFSMSNSTALIMAYNTTAKTVVSRIPVLNTSRYYSLSDFLNAVSLLSGECFDSKGTPGQEGWEASVHSGFLACIWISNLNCLSIMPDDFLSL